MTPPGSERRGLRRSTYRLSVSRGRREAVCLAIPGCIVDVVDEPNRLARVEIAGVRRTINIGLLDSDGEGAGPGDWVLVHVGFAMSKVDEEEARATREFLLSLGEPFESELEEYEKSTIE